MLCKVPNEMSLFEFSGLKSTPKINEPHSIVHCDPGPCCMDMGVRTQIADESITTYPRILCDHILAGRVIGRSRVDLEFTLAMKGRNPVNGLRPGHIPVAAIACEAPEHLGYHFALVSRQRSTWQSTG